MMGTNLMWILLTGSLLAFGHGFSLANEDDMTALNDEMEFDASNQDDVIIPLKNFESASNQDDVIIPLKNFESASNQDEVIIPLMNQDEYGKTRDKRWWGLAAKVLYKGAKIGRKIYCQKKPGSRICGKK